MKQILRLGILICSIAILRASELDRIIPPEIKNDPFYHAIFRLSSTEKIVTILEIGSSSGQGSTEAFVRGIKLNPFKPHLFCMELSKPRFQALKQLYSNCDQVHCYNVSSVPLDMFPDELSVTNFMNTIATNLNQYGLKSVLGWLRQDIEYVEKSGLPANGIEIIKNENNIDHFDMVLIDGSEFTGFSEFKLIYGARFILLDDINAFKNYHSYQFLLSDENYQLLEHNLTLRNGYAIFKKKIS